MSLNQAHEGYDYQDLLTSYFILNEILKGRKNSLFIIDRKNTPKDIPDNFDDLVIINDSKIQRKQIKFSNDNTSKKLKKEDLANNSGYKLALFELYRTWKELNTANSEFRLCLAWDEPTDENIKDILESLSSNLSSFEKFPTKLYKINLDKLWKEGFKPLDSWRSLKKFVQENNIERNDFKQFCDSLIIELELPKASLNFNTTLDLEKILFKQAEQLGIGQYPNDNVYIKDFLERLVKKVSEYRTRSAEVTGIEVLKDLRVKTDFGKIEQKFEIDQTKNIKPNDKYALFQAKVKENKKTLFIGEPGSGKSWFLTNFIEYLEKNHINVIRHYCFTDTEDKFLEKRVSSDVFFGNLISDIIDKFPELENKKSQRYVSNLDELNLLLSYIDKELVIIIDGLDHIDRVLKNSSTLSKDKTKIIEYISQINTPSNISIILGSQSVEEIKPLINNFDYIEYKLDKWKIEDIVLLMKKYSLKDIEIDGKLLSIYLLEKSEGNPLYLTYLIKTLLNQQITFETINSLPEYDFNLKNYYDYLTYQMQDTLTSEILACLDFSITIEELKNINPQNHHLEEDLKILSPVLKENASRGGIKLYHDSFRRYNIEKLEQNDGLKNIYKLIVKWLDKEGFYKNSKTYRYLLSYYIKLNKYKKVKKYATNKFLTKSLYFGYSEKSIKANYDHFLYVAQKTNDWSLFIYLSEFNRTMQATLSDSYNEFEERFEEYFEAVGLIYGFEKANEILFFDGKQNYSDEIIAKAFYIFQKNGYIPNWQRIKHYFKDKIPLKKLKYLIAYLIAENKLFEIIKKNRVFLFENLDYIKVLVEETYILADFDEIVYIFEQIKCKHKDLLAKKINNILDNTECNQRILFTNQSEYLCLPPLNLDFINDYIKEGVLDEFYNLVELYSRYNILALEEFEKNIPSKNFFYNWLKFLIRNFLIEAKINQNKFSNYQLLEDEFIKKFEFLASDVEPFKGNPRAIDFNSNNKEIFLKTLKQALKYINSSESWEVVIFCLNKISNGTSAYLQSIQMGILDDRNLIELLLNHINDKNSSYIEKILQGIDKKDEVYSSHLEYKLKKSIFYAKIGQVKKARKNLKQAMKLVTSYTFRKDRTASEIINPLTSINKIDKEFALKYTKKLKFLLDAIEKHTEDGKDIRWLPIEWFGKFIKIDSRLSAMYLIDQLLKYPNFWKLEYMFVNYIIFHKTDVNPIILNFLFRTLPTNIKDNYIKNYLDNIYNLVGIDKTIAYTSLVNILNRKLNDSYDKLSKKTTLKLQALKNILNVSIPIQLSGEDRVLHHSFQEKKLEEKLTIQFGITESLKEKSIEEIKKYFDKQDRELSDKDLIFLLHFFNEKNDDELVKNILEPIIIKRFIGDEKYYEKLRELVNNLKCSSDSKIYLLVKIFVYSQGGWLENFVNKNAFKDAIELDKQKALDYLSVELSKKFQTIYYYSQSTANLIIAFEYAGLKKKDILSMYKRGFKFIEYRLPDDHNFDWNSIEDEKLKDMSNDEIAIVMMLVKSKNMDAIVQKEILFAINYLFNYKRNLLIKPLKWFFENIEHFSHIFVASILELFLIYADKNKTFFQDLKDDISKVDSLKNLYISNCLKRLTERINNV